MNYKPLNPYKVKKNTTLPLLLKNKQSAFQSIYYLIVQNVYTVLCQGEIRATLLYPHPPFTQQEEVCLYFMNHKYKN